jgi:hypothetical protein
MNEARLDALSQCARAVDEVLDTILRNHEPEAWQVLTDAREAVLESADPELAATWRDLEKQVRDYEDGDQTMNQDQYEETRDAREEAFFAIVTDWRN